MTQGQLLKILPHSGRNLHRSFCQSCISIKFCLSKINYFNLQLILFILCLFVMYELHLQLVVLHLLIIWLKAIKHHIIVWNTYLVPKFTAISCHWYCLFVRNEQSQRSASGFVRLCQKIDWLGTRTCCDNNYNFNCCCHVIFWQSLTKPDAKCWLCSNLTKVLYQCVLDVVVLYVLT